MKNCGTPSTGRDGCPGWEEVEKVVTFMKDLLQGTWRRIEDVDTHIIEDLRHTFAYILHIKLTN